MVFADAVGEFREFLRKQGHVGPLVWVTRGNVAFWRGKLLVRRDKESAARAEQLFKQADARGYGVAIEAVAQLRDEICCYIFAPKDPEDAADHFVAPPLTLKAQDKLRSAREANHFEWWLARTFASPAARRRVLYFFGSESDRQCSSKASGR
jgi:hypothetical protein